MDPVCLIELGFLNLGPTEIIVILVIAILLFGGRLPEVARSIGKVFFEFRKNVRDLQNDLYRPDYDPPRNLPKPYHHVDGEIHAAPPVVDVPPAKETEDDAEETGGDPRASDTKK